jgi:hypothetical protein
MYELLKRTKAEDLLPDTLPVLQDISENCRSCQVFRNKEVTFSSRLKGDTVFNRSNELDLCYIDSRPVLHITDKDTKYGVSRFVRCSSKIQPRRNCGTLFVQAWALAYIGMPDVVMTDRGTQFTSKDFELALSYHGVKQQYTAVKSHHSLGANERAQAVVRLVYLKTRHGHPNFHKNCLLHIPRRRSTKLSGRMESFRHCSCTVLCRDFVLPVLTPAFSRTLNVSAVWLLHELNTRGL